MDRDQLRAAVEADVISADQASRLEAMFRKDDSRLIEGEPLRFLSNLNDVFLSIGIIILLVGSAAALSILTFGQTSFADYAPMILLPLAVFAWGLSEYFCKRRRLLLPSIVLSIFWTVSIGVAVLTIFVWNAIEDGTVQIAGNFASGLDGPDADEVIFGAIESSRMSVVMGLLASAGAALLYYIRFRLPFSQFLIMMSLSLIAVYLLPGYGTLLFTGIGTLLLGIYFDARDPDRASRLSDNAFWLHVAAAPQIVYGLRGIMESSFGANSTMVHVGLVSALAAIALISLALNRRALIISGLLTFGWAIWNLFQAFGDSIFMRFAGPLLLIGLLIVLLGSGWKTARRILLFGVPATGLTSRIFPKEV